MVNPFQDRVDKLSSALARLRHAADDAMRLMDDCVSSFQKIDVEEYPDPFEVLGSLRATVQPFYDGLHDTEKIFNSVISRSKETLSHFQSHISSSAMKYGLNRLPDELLSRILFDAAVSLESTEALSHVSQRFRSIITGTPAFWQKFTLSSGWRAERIMAIAERSTSQHLKAAILSRRSNDSVIAIFSLYPYLEHLTIFGLSETHVEEIRRRLGPLHFPSLRALHSVGCPNLALLHTEKIPGMPSLHTLDVDFIPHISQARNLVTLSITVECLVFANLVVFLSSTTRLQNLHFHFWEIAEEDQQQITEPVQLPNLVKLCFSSGAYGFTQVFPIIAKIRASSLRLLEVYRNSFSLGVGAGPVQNAFRSDPSVKELVLSGLTNLDLCHIPPQVEVLTLMGRDRISPFVCSGTVSSHQLRLIRFAGASKDSYAYVVHIRKVLRGAGLDDVCFEFEGSHGCRAGTFHLDDVEGAFID